MSWFLPLFRRDRNILQKKTDNACEIRQPCIVCFLSLQFVSEMFIRIQELYGEQLMPLLEMNKVDKTMPPLIHINKHNQSTNNGNLQSNVKWFTNVLKISNCK